jgi:MutS-like protein
MRVLLMHPDRDWDQEPALTESFRWFRRSPTPELSRHEQALVQDLALETLLGAMTDGDEFLFEVARRALLSGLRDDMDTILHRQAIVKDCLKHPAVVRELYALAVETIGAKRKFYMNDHARYPSSILYSAIEALQMFVGMLRKLKAIADAHAGRFESRGLTTLFAMLQREFSEEYFASIQNHLTELKFRHGTLVSAALGKGSEGTNYVLRQPRDDPRNWLERLLGKGAPGYTFYIHERDEAGARALGELRDRGINLVASALAQSTEHMLSFFEVLRVELAFYVCCLNLHDKLTSLGTPLSYPQPGAVGVRRLRCSGLYDVCLALSMGRSVVGNALNAEGKSLVIITGANEGGKSTFLRSMGLAQLMMQCGMFVPAEAFAAELCAGLFTHYKREEDATMTHGKLDEELARMSQIVDTIRPNAILLFNESFASTNEREGSEIARQVVSALLEKSIKIFFVTHQYEFARGLFEQSMDDAVFLRAERQPDGTRTFRLVEGEPLETSFGEDLYKEIFKETEELRAG